MYKKDTINWGMLNRYTYKIGLIMRLTTVILIATMMQVSAASFAQKINLTRVNTPLREIVKDLANQSGYDFVAKESLLKTANAVTINVKGVDLLTVLDQIFENQPITYWVDGRIVMLKPKENSFIDKLINRYQEIDVSGIVTDEYGIGLVGATVRWKDKVTRTGKYGAFLLKNVPDDAIIEFSYIGYGTRKINAGRNLGAVILKQSDSKLDEIQVIAYGKTTQRFNIGSVSTITAKDLESQPVTSVLDAMQGRIAGLKITTTTGVPGSRTLAQVRGQNNLGNRPDAVLNAYDQPLFVVDGVPMPLQNNPLIGNGFSVAGGLQSLQNQGGLSSINGINPLDIESISVLKDADATSIYGSQGSNGVILITTKRGKAGAEQFSASFNTGFTNASRTIPMMNTEQYLSMRREAIANSKVTPGPISDPDLLLFDQNRYTDWMKEFFGGTAKRTDLHLSLSGGSISDNYLISGGYTRATYNYPGDMSDQRYSIHTAFGHQSSDQRFKLDFGADYSYGINNNSGSPTTSLLAFTMAPNFPELLNTDGTPVWSYKGYPFIYGYQGNPLASLLGSAKTGTHSLNSFLNTTYKISADLNLSINAGYGRISENAQTARPIKSQDPQFGPTGSASFRNRNTDMINIIPQLNFNKNIWNGVLSVLAGGTYKKNYSNGFGIDGSGYTSDALLNSVTGARTTFTTNAASYYKYVDVFTRINYRYADRYILNLSGNRSGSSNFGPDKKFGVFGSAGLGWIVSEEQWLKDKFSFLSYVKLAVNYGTSGSDGITPYQYQPNWLADSYYTYQDLPGYNPINPLNPVYSWALSKKFNEQLDLGFFKDRLLLNFSMYQNKTANQLVSYLQPIQTGFGSITTNAPYEVGNSGWELTLTSNHVRSKDFNWSSTLNVSHNTNKLLSFPDLAATAYAPLYVLGKPLNAVQLLPYAGIDQATGLFQFRTASGEVTSFPNRNSGFNNVGGDQTQLLDLNPKLQGGLGNTLNYKNFSLTLFFQFSVQKGPNYLYNIYSSGVASMPGAPMVNMPAFVLGKQWQKAGDQATMQKFVDGYYGSDGYLASSTASAFASSTGAYSDASYIRLKTASFSYKLPDSWTKKLFLKNCSIYANAQNLFVITGYEAGDPETMGLFNIPPQRTVVMGINASF